jgi:predicted transcriptional regulator YheO
MNNETVLKTEVHPILTSYIPVARGIAQTFGSFCEVVIHDFSDVSSSIVAIFNQNVSGREVGSPVTNLGLEVIRKGFEGEDTLINYANNSSTHKKIKSSSMMIRDEQNTLIGCLCINVDLTYLQLANNVLEGIMSTVQEEEKQEEFSPSINDLEDQLIEDAVAMIGKPIPIMDKAEREKFIHYLDEKGLFLIKGAVQKIASMLKISKYTLYNYIDKS